MADPNPEYEIYAKSVKTIFLFSGLWPGPAPFLYYQYIIVALMIGDTLMLCANFNFMYANINDISLVTKSMSLFVTGTTALLKVLMYTMNKARLVVMHKTLEATFRDDYSKEDLQKVLMEPLNIFTRVNWAVSRFYLAIPIVYCFGPLISLIVQLIHGEVKLKYSMPFLSKYPWNPTKNFVVFFFMYLFECFGSCGVGLVSAATDAVFSFYVFQISTQFRVLTYQMTNLRPTDDYRAVIKRCVRKKLTLVECCDCLQRIYGPVVLWFMVSSAVNLCTNIYQITKTSSDGILPCIVYIVGKLIQTMVYAWLGTFLSSESEAFCDAAYNCDWAGSGEKPLMTNILILLMRKPVALSACNFSTISLDMFVGIVNTAFSYFFLLQTLEE